jgi:polysaccharide chain length determinant protein (PEP-CTERM system associated)
MTLNDNRQQLQLQQYVDLFLRNKWLITLPFILITLGSFIYALAIPNIYQASTTILVVPQKVPENYVRSTVPAAVADRLQTLNQQIMSRTRLQQVIERYGLYREASKKMAPEEIIELMRRKIDVSVDQRTRNGVNSFSLSFQNPDPRIAMQVANGLASLYIEENLKLRERQARETANFLDRELAKLEKQLSEKEQLLSAFKKKYMGELPDQQDANLRMLDRLEIQYQTSSAALAAAKDRQIQLQQQLNQLSSSTDTVVVEGRVMAVDPDVARLEAMKEELSALRNRYTDAHPDVISLVAKTGKLEKELAAKKKAETENDGVQEAAQRPRSPASVEINNQITSVRHEISQLQHELKRLRSEIDVVNAKVENSPKREAELVALTRDYGNLHQNYQNLLDRKIEAQLAENLEMQQQGEQFKVLDPAQLPVKPFKPDRRKILLAGMVLGLGVGVGLALLLDFLGKSYRYVPDIEEDLGLPVLVTIPKILTGEELKWRKIKNVGGALVVFMAMLAAGGLGYMYFKLTFSLPGWFQQTFFHL